VPTAETDDWQCLSYTTERTGCDVQFDRRFDRVGGRSSICWRPADRRVSSTGPGALSAPPGCVRRRWWSHDETDARSASWSGKTASRGRRRGAHPPTRRLKLPPPPRTQTHLAAASYRSPAGYTHADPTRPVKEDYGERENTRRYSTRVCRTIFLAESTAVCLLNQNKPALTRVQWPTPALLLWLVTLTFWPQNKCVSRTHRGTFVCRVWRS